MFIYSLNDFEEKAENYFSFCYVLEHYYILFILLLGVGQQHLISSPLLSSDDKKKMMKRKKKKKEEDKSAADDSRFIIISLNMACSAVVGRLDEKKTIRYVNWRMTARAGDWNRKIQKLKNRRSSF